MRRHDEFISFSATEVGNFLACQHLTSLELRVADGELELPAQNDIERRLLEKRGLEHEARVLEYFRQSGLTPVEIKAAPSAEGLRSAAEQTLAAMRDGAELIYQGTLLTPGWVGRPDFLRKVTGEGAWGHHYEPIDAKLAHEAKARAVLQMCAYADQLQHLQGVFPRRFHVAGGGTELTPQTLLTGDYAAYFRAVRRRMRAFVEQAGTRATYPEPVEHCGVCRFWKQCEDRRRSDDHLSLVAGISRRQRDRLGQAGIERLEQLGSLDRELRIEGIAAESLERVREQARLQLEGRREGRAKYELLLNEPPGVGLAALPKPTPGDLFLDLEGDSFVLGDGLDYLFGLVDFGEPEIDSFSVRDVPGAPRYQAFWAENREQERRAFEQVVDRVRLGRQEFPSLHVYHFGHREADALKKLSCRHASREAEVDQLLREGVLVDLLPIVKHGLRASVESYSLKELEVFHGFQRATPLRQAARAMQLFGWWLETGDQSVPLGELRQSVQSYNREDCLSTAQLRDFLERLRREQEQRLGAAIPRPERDPKQVNDELSERQQATAELAKQLTADPGHPAAPQRQLLANLLDFHWREAKSGWWEYHRARELAPADRLEDKSCIEGLRYEGEVERIKQSTVHLYRFPEQDHSLRTTPEPIDPDTQKSPGKVVELGSDFVKIRRGNNSTTPHPSALIVGKPIDSKPLPDSLLALGRAVLAGESGFQAARALLFRTPPPSAGGGALLRDGELPERALARLGSELEGSVIAVQGPPGSGKTYQAALLILSLLRQGKRVGVTANSHSVIKGVLQQVCKEAEKEGEPDLVRALHLDGEDRDDKVWPFRIDDKKDRARAELESGRVNVLGGTAWTWARDEFAESVDVLVIDEAGQMALANALAVARAGRGLVLFGDPAQLEQPQKGVHPLGAEVSTLEHWLGGDVLTIPPDRGVFLPTTRRLHPKICDFISATFYEGRLAAAEGLGLEHQAVAIAGETFAAGVRFVPSQHRGNTSQASEEVETVQLLVDRCLEDGSRFRGRDGASRPLTPADVLVVAPYNAQVAALRRALPEGVRVGTVDKFQGREAPVVIYSMTSSSAEDAPRGLEFLYSRNRLNVAVSRAQALCFVVASPELARAACKTPPQMRLVNAWCTYLEAAER